MTLCFYCREVGFDCDYKATGETEEEVLEKAKAHGKEEHGLSDEEVNDPEMEKKIRSLIKEEESD